MVIQFCFGSRLALFQPAILFGIPYQKRYDIAKKLHRLIKERGLEKFKTAGNWAVFTYMTDSLPINNFKPYMYDFENFIPDKDPTVGFVTKLLITGKGNCISLPELYKILSNEIGANAYLALAPIYCYIKHKDESGKWVNLEMTSDSFARDEWIMQQTGVTVEQIKSGIYMNALSQKESLAFVLKELAINYQFQFGVGDFDLKVIETALKYYPTGINLYMAKFEHFRKKLLQAREQNNLKLEQQYNKILFDIDQKFIELAYKELSKQEYEEWVKDNEKNKKLHSSTTKQKSSINGAGGIIMNQVNKSKWYDLSMEGDLRKGFYNATQIIDNFKNSTSDWKAAIPDEASRVAMINFVTDGYLPTAITGQFPGSEYQSIRLSAYENQLNTAWYGFQIMQASNIEIREQTRTAVLDLLKKYKNEGEVLTLTLSANI